MKSVIALAFVAPAFLALVAGCRDESQSPVDTPRAIASASPSVAGYVELASVSESAAAVATAVASGDISALVRMSVTRSMACVDVPSPQNTGPVCRDGDPAGSIYSAFPTAVCSGGWAADLRQLFGNLAERAGLPVILATLGSPPVGWPSDRPYGREILVFSPKSPGELIAAVAVYMEAGAIVRVQLGCRTVEGFITNERPVPEVVWRSKPVP